MEPHSFLRAAEAAEQCRMRPSTLERLIRTGRGPRITRLGGKVLIRSDHWREWLESGVGAELPESDGRKRARAALPPMTAA